MSDPGYLSLWRRALRVFGSALDGQRSALVVSLLLSLGVAALELIRPWPVKFVIDHVILAADGVVGPLGWSRNTILIASCLTLLAVAASLGSVNTARAVRVAQVGRKVATRIRRAVFEHVHRLGLPFHRSARSGDLLVRLTGDVNLVRDFMVASWINMIGRGTLFIAMLTMMAILDPLLAVIAIAPLPLLFVRIRRSSRDLSQVTKKQRKREGAAAAVAAETLRHVPLVKAYASEEAEAKRFARLSRAGERAGVKAARLSAEMARQTELITGIGLAAVLFVGARRAMGGAISAGDLLVLLSYARAIYKPIRGLAREGTRLAKSAACASRLLELMEKQPEIHDEGEPVDGLRGVIALDRVSFAYDDDALALDDVSVTIPEGSLALIRGENGAGKSTLLSLLLRLHAPTSGSIRIAGRSVDDYRLGDYRSQFAYVPQNLHLFGTTIRDNVLYGRPEATAPQIDRAIRAAMLESVIERLPDGIDTVLGEDGASISGGEARRVMLARAAVRDASILVFDEPTAGLDPEASRTIVRAMRRIADGRTAIVISHDGIDDLAPDLAITLAAGRVVNEVSAA